MFDLSPHQEIADQDISDLFQQFFSAYEQAVTDIGGGTTDIHLRIARENVCLKFAGEHLASPLSRALLHSRSEPVTTPDITICVWDSAASGTRLPPELDRFKRYVTAYPNAGLRAIRGNVPMFTNDRFRTALMGETSLTMVDVTSKLCIHWILDPSEIPYYETGAPLRVPFSYLFSSENRQLLHGGAIGRTDGGVFLGGL